MDIDSEMASYVSPRLHYFSRRSDKDWIQLDVDDGSWVGILSPWAFFYAVLFLLIPICYVYIGLVLLRDLCLSFPDTLYASLLRYLPNLAILVEFLHERSSRFVEVWCWIEGIFYLCVKYKIRWLQAKDPLEASLSAAPIMDLEERQQLWEHMMESEHDLAGVLRGWFFDQPLENIR